MESDQVTKIFMSDTKRNISSAYLAPGFAFGGSCLPKDLRAITHRAKELDLQLPMLESLMPSNAQHIERGVEAVLRTGKRKIAMLGLSFKAGTDDLRESPQVQLIKRLRADNRWTAVPVIVLSTRGSADDKQRAAVAGADGHLPAHDVHHGGGDHLGRPAAEGPEDLHQAVARGGGRGSRVASSAACPRRSRPSRRRSR